MPSLESDEILFFVESEIMLSTASSKEDFPTATEDDGPKFSSYGSITSRSPARSAPLPPVLLAASKDAEGSSLLLPPLPPPTPAGGPLGLTRTDLAALMDDPFWRRLRALLFSCFWLLVAAMLGAVAWIVATDPHRCPAAPPSPSASPPPMPEPTPSSLLLHAAMAKY